MKKLLLVLAGSMLASAGAFAAIDAPKEYAGINVMNLSPNAVWGAGNDYLSGVFAIINFETGEMWDYSEELDGESYGAAYGHGISNDGVVVSQTSMTQMPVYWYKGEWHNLPVGETDFGGCTNAITPDGSRIAGSVYKAAMSIDEDNTMAVPVIWNRNAEGEYEMYEVIAYPQRDWTNRVPQYVQALDMSADGKIIAIDVTDYSGMAHQIGVSRQDAEGNWTYADIHNELINPEGIVLPDYPGEAPEMPEYTNFMTEEERIAYQLDLDEYMYRPMPEFTDYMTAEELDAYFEALENYENDWEHYEYPFFQDYMSEEELDAYNNAIDEYYSVPKPKPTDYMTEDEIAAYDAAFSKYIEDFEVWEMAYSEFENAFYDVIANPNAVIYEMNSMHLSTDGRYFVTTTDKLIEDEMSWSGFSAVYTPYVFDLEEDTYTAMELGMNNIYATMVNNDGVVLGNSNTDDLVRRQAVIAEGLDKPFRLLSEYIAERNTQLSEWMVENMTHEIPVYDDAGNPEYQTMIVTGTPTATEDLEYIVTGVYNSWEDSMNAENFYSYILHNIDTSSISSAAGNSIALATLNSKGILTVKGNVASVEIFDLNGRKVFEVANPANVINTGLSKGVYVVKYVNKEGSAKMNKAII